MRTKQTEPSWQALLRLRDNDQCALVGWELPEVWFALPVSRCLLAQEIVMEIKNCTLQIKLYI